MNELVLSQEELALLRRIAGERTSGLYRYAFHAATVAPTLAFAAFGVARRDLLALALAFFGLLALYLWRLGAESGVAPVFRSLCQKILDHQPPTTHVDRQLP